MRNPDNFGWIVDPTHRIDPKPNKEGWVDVAIGLGIAFLGIVWIAVSAFSNGAHAFQDEETRILYETGCIKQLDENTVLIDDFDYMARPKTDANE